MGEEDTGSHGNDHGMTRVLWFFCVFFCFFFFSFVCRKEERGAGEDTEYVHSHGHKCAISMRHERVLIH